MNYIERLVGEYKELIEKRVLLEKALGKGELEPMIMDREENELLSKQLDIMFQYEEILFVRICKMLKK